MIILYILLGILALATIAGAIFYLTQPKPEAPAEEYKKFIGKWVNEMGNFVIIYDNGKASYQGPNSSITGGVIRFTGQNSFSIHFGPFRKTFTITEEPNEKADHTSISLDGIIYTKASFDHVSGIQKLTPDLAAQLNKKHLQLFNESIQHSDVNYFLPQTSPYFQKSFSKEAFLKQFTVFYENKVDLSPWLENFPKEATLKQDKEDVIASENVIFASQGTMKIETKYHLLNGKFELLLFGLSIEAK